MQDERMQSSRVLIVGAGIAGIACANALRSAGIAARVVDRGRRAGGRMASRTINGRTVDLGAAYFTVEPGSPFDGVVADWVERGLARPWTDTLAVAGADGIHDSRSGPMRYAAATGLRGLVLDLARGLDVEQGVTVEHVAPGEADGKRYDAVVLAMPDPQAGRLLDAASPLRGALEGAWVPSIAVVLEWAAREWSPFRAAFVNDSPVLTTLRPHGRGGAPRARPHRVARALLRAPLDVRPAERPARRAVPLGGRDRRLRGCLGRALVRGDGLGVG
jgi:renalase